MELSIGFSSASPHNETPQIYYPPTAAAAPPIRRRKDVACLSAAYLRGAGMLTGFPDFAEKELLLHLGSPNPRLTNVAEETLLHKMSRILT